MAARGRRTACESRGQTLRASGTLWNGGERFSRKACTACGIGYEQYRDYLEAFTRALVNSRWGNSLASVVLYGSGARCTARETSDLELFIVQRGAPSSYDERLEPLLELARGLRKGPEFQTLVCRGLVPSLGLLVLSEAEGEEDRHIFPDTSATSRPRFLKGTVTWLCVGTQEVVELALKGALRILGVDFPKVRHVVPVFAEQMRSKGVASEGGPC